MESVHANQLNVLVIEDDDFQRQMIIRMLNSLGVASIADAANGKQALNIVCNNKSQPLDVVLCDLNMPEMDGMEFVRHLGEGQHNISIIIISGLDRKLLASVEKMIHSYKIKLLGTIEKPLTIESLERLLSHYERSDPAVPQVKEKIFILDEIRQGIRDHQFEPYYQPKVELQSGRIIGAEILARWVHPTYGLIDPFSFIPQLEKSGMIDELTFTMLEQSVKQCCLFHALGYNLTIAINLSPASLEDSSLADKITRLVRKAGLDPKYIMFEITESAAISEVAHILENLARLCMHGFALSIDDYGTGYSSMQQLTHTSFSELKIDQSFITDLTGNADLKVIVESNIDMAHKLNMKSVAEGIETQQDWDILSKMRCDTGQGYFFAKPMDAASFLALLQQYIPWKSSPD
jgi:EAL domain-containing protein (putative c-di-GMP-specific phosphodiesterase class I)/FixJ family two-component response regulator